MMEKGTVVFARDGLVAGVSTGATHRCRLEGCNGLRVTVKWPDGKITHPCTKGMATLPSGQWKIV